MRGVAMAEPTWTALRAVPGREDLDLSVVLELFLIPFGFFDKMVCSLVGSTFIWMVMLVRVLFTTVASGALATFGLNDLADWGLVESSAALAPSMLRSSAVFLRRFRSDIMFSSASADDVFLFRSTREPSMGSSSRTSWLKTECESGLIA